MNDFVNVAISVFWIVAGIIWAVLFFVVHWSGRNYNAVTDSPTYLGCGAYITGTVVAIYLIGWAIEAQRNL